MALISDFATIVGSFFFFRTLAGHVLKNATIVDSGSSKTLAGNVLRNTTIVDSGFSRTLAGNVVRNTTIVH